MKLPWFSLKTAAVALCLLLISAGQVQAQSDSVSDDEWQSMLKIYLWGAGIDGKTALGGDLSIDFSQLLDNLEFAFMAGYEGRKGDWGVLIDGMYLDVEGNKTIPLGPDNGPDIIDPAANVTLGLKGTVLTFGGLYRLQDSGPNQAHLVFGGRYLDLSSPVTIGFSEDVLPETPDLSFKLTDDFLDAVIGFKGNAAFADRWNFLYYGDIGTGDSDLTWQAMAGVSFSASDWADIVLTYRYLHWDLGSGLDDLTMSGPLLGVAFRW